MICVTSVLHREWFGLFDAIVTADDPEVGAAKPAPDIFLTAARRLGVAPEDCLVFEDSPFGVTAAKAAHMTAIAVPDEAMADSKYHHADQIIRKLADFDLAAYGYAPSSAAPAPQRPACPRPWGNARSSAARGSPGILRG